MLRRRQSSGHRPLHLGGPSRASTPACSHVLLRLRHHGRRRRPQRLDLPVCCLGPPMSRLHRLSASTHTLAQTPMQCRSMRLLVPLLGQAYSRELSILGAPPRVAKINGMKFLWSGPIFHATSANAASGSGLYGHGYGLLQGQMQSSSLEGAQPSFDISSTGHGSKHGQSLSHPSAKPHPLQHLVDIHNVGPVSAFSRDPAAFTGTNYSLYSHLPSLEGHPPSGGSVSGPVVQSNASCRPLGTGCLLCSSDSHSRLISSGVLAAG